MQQLQRIAVIGVGRMGGGIARNLARPGDVEVTVFDPERAAVDRCVQVGAQAAAGAVDAVADADLVITSLPLPHHVHEVYSEITGHLAPDAIVMDTSTVDPATAAHVASGVGRHRFVSCLLGKGPAQAETGDVPLFVGGPVDVLDVLAPVFARIGSGVHRLGTVEAATTFKLVSNLIGMTNLAVLAEGYSLCHASGVDDDAFAAALADTGGWSYQAEVRLPWMTAGDFTPRFSVALGLKDLALALGVAAHARVPVPVGAAGMAQLASAIAHGFGDEDVAAVLKVVDPARA